MNNDLLIEDIAALKKGSRASISMVAFGIVFLVGSIAYSTYNLWPLKDQVKQLQVNVEKLEAKKAELTGFAAAVDAAAKPVLASASERTGWIYIGRISSTGSWAPKSDRILVADAPGALMRGATVTTQSNVALIDDIDTTSNPTPSAAGNGERTRLFIRPGTKLTVSDLREQNSVSGGKFMWIKADVAGGDLLSLDQP